jgi:hypothetical protein
MLGLLPSEPLATVSLWRITPACPHSKQHATQRTPLAAAHAVTVFLAASRFASCCSKISTCSPFIKA